MRTANYGEYTLLAQDREYWAKGRRLGYFNDFTMPKWMKGEGYD
jgi:hypothetical protein